jgi:hypothetical protein
MGLACAFRALQPVQLVSMNAAPGETEKAALAEVAVTGPAPQPARRAKPAIARNESNRKRRANGRKAAVFAPG